MRRAVVMLLMGAGLLSGACGGSGDGPVPASAAALGATPSAAATAVASGDPIVIQTELTIAAEEGSEPIATGVVVDGSELGGLPFCADGTILDTHASNDPAVASLGLIDRTFTCPDGTVRIVLTPGEPGTWMIVSGTGVYDGLGGAGQLSIVMDPVDRQLGRETLDGTATRADSSAAP